MFWRGIYVANIILLIIIASTVAELTADSTASTRVPLGITSLEPRCRLLSKGDVKLILGLQGLHHELKKVLVEDLMTDIETRTDSSVTVRLKLSEKNTPGSMTISIQTPEEQYTWKAAFYVAGDPSIEVDPITKAKGKQFLQAGDSISVQVPGVPSHDLTVTLAGRLLKHVLVDSLLRVEIPPDFGGQPKSELALTAFGELFWNKNYEIIPVPEIDESRLTYNQTDQELQANLWGQHLTEDLTIQCKIGNAAATSILEFLATNQDKDIAEFKTQVSEGPKSKNDEVLLEVLWRGKKIYTAQEGEWQHIAGRWEWESTPAGARLKDKLDRIIVANSIGEIKLGGAYYSFACIPIKDDYRIGMTEEQRKDPFLLSRGFSTVSTAPLKKALKVKLDVPFLIQTTEITCEQYWSYLIASNDQNIEVPKSLREYRNRKEPQRVLPRQLRLLPVTGISYHGAQKFTQWLQEKMDKLVSGWQVRLPHEIEWEMAAREGEQRYAFPQSVYAPAIEEFNKYTGPRAVCSNSHDKTTRGVWDMSGNVSELTETVFSEDFLAMLDTKLTALLFEAWDPRNPYNTEGLLQPHPPMHQSVSMCVRGGANGENPSLLQVSVRRGQEWSSVDEKVGFRLVLVKRAD